MTDMTPDKAKALRKPFDAEQVGKLPKPYSAQSQKGNCKECGGYHGLPAAHLDYVGHAATTDRLLIVDPGWNWEPFTTDPQGLPALDGRGNLWIRLTVCGVTRIGVGDGKSLKECIGDAIRNAAMRFGVALDLWAKEDLEQSKAPVSAVGDVVRPQPATARAADFTSKEPDAESTAQQPMTPRTRGQLFALLTERGVTDRAEQIRGITHIIGHPITSRSELTEDEARAVILQLRATTQPAEPPLDES